MRVGGGGEKEGGGQRDGEQCSPFPIPLGGTHGASPSSHHLECPAKLNQLSPAHHVAVCLQADLDHQQNIEKGGSREAGMDSHLMVNNPVVPIHNGNGRLESSAPSCSWLLTSIESQCSLLLLLLLVLGRDPGRHSLGHGHGGAVHFPFFPFFLRDSSNGLAARRQQTMVAWLSSKTSSTMVMTMKKLLSSQATTTGHQCHSDNDCQ